MAIRWYGYGWCHHSDYSLIIVIIVNVFLVKKGVQNDHGSENTQKEKEISFASQQVYLLFPKLVLLFIFHKNFQFPENRYHQ